VSDKTTGQAVSLPERLARFSLEGRVAMITGAGSGMGRACALMFAAAGAHVLAADIDAAALEELEAENDGAGEIQPAPLDATDLDAVRAFLATVEADHGRLDVLFNHAGSACAPGLELTEEDWLKGTDLNLRVPVLLTAAALPLLRRSESASLIYTGSIAALVASPNSPLYSAMKGGIMMFAKSVAAGLGPEGIRANVICPGTMETPMLIDFFRGTPGGLAAAESNGVVTRTDVDDGVGRFAEQVPLRRTGQPDEVAELALFLASDASRYVTGAAIPVDGGYVAR